MRRAPEVLRPAAVAGLAALLYLGMLGVHRVAGLPLDDVDITTVYPREGGALLATGTLPAVEYPPGAVLLFALALKVGDIALSLPLLTLPVLLAGWWAVARSRPGAAWLVAVAALWPTLEFFWEVKFDAVPTGLFLLGMAAAFRERWGWAGLAFGLGAGVKWWPALAAVTIAAALLRRRELRSLAALAAASVAGALAVHLPFLGSGTLLHPYRFQSGRELTGESLPFVPLHLLGIVGRPEKFHAPAGAPAWTNTASFVVMALALALVVYAAWRIPRRALPLAAVSVVAFFLLNRVFSAQFMLPLAAAWVAAVVFSDARTTRRDELWLLVLLGISCIANYAIYPVESPHWVQFEWIQFGAALALTALVLARFAIGRRAPQAASTSSGGSSPGPRISQTRASSASYSSVTASHE
jgi:hypothetical protein